jgi:recombination protein RecT
MSTEVATRTPAQELVARVRNDEFMQQIATALPEGISPDRFVRATVTALLQNPEIAGVPDQSSLFAALLQAAQDGLVPDGRQAALVKRGNKAIYHAMIHGFRHIAAEHGWMLRTDVVYANDDFDYTTEPPTITHRPVRPGGERGPLIAAYAVAIHRDGRRMQSVLHKDDIEKRRAKATTQAVWNEWTPQMYEKSAGRDLFGQLPLADRDRVERVLAASVDVGADEAARLLYGVTPRRVEVQAGDGRGLTAETEAPDQQAGASPSLSPGEAPAPDLADEPDTGEEPKAESPFTIEAVARDAADAAGRYVVTVGKHAGKTIAQIGSEPRGAGWIGWAIKAKDLEAAAYAKAWAKVHAPDTYQAAIAELQVEAQ